MRRTVDSEYRAFKNPKEPFLVGAGAQPRVGSDLIAAMNVGAYDGYLCRTHPSEGLSDLIAAHKDEFKDHDSVRPQDVLDVV